MRHGVLVLSIVGVALGAFALGRAGAQEGVDPGMEAWLKLGEPGAEHAELMENAGTWTVDSKAWMTPGAEPAQSKGKAVFTALFDGRYLRQEFEGDFMGTLFRGVSIAGFNNASGKYEEVWIDCISTGIMHSTGTRTEPGVWALSGACAGPGGKEMKMRSVLKRVSADKLFVESFCDEGSGERKCWEATYTRSK